MSPKNSEKIGRNTYIVLGILLVALVAMNFPKLPSAQSGPAQVSMGVQLKYKDGTVRTKVPGLSIIDPLLDAWQDISGNPVVAFRWIASVTVTGQNLQPSSVITQDFRVVMAETTYDAAGTVLLSHAEGTRDWRRSTGNFVVISGWVPGVAASDGSFSQTSEYLFSNYGNVSGVESGVVRLFGTTGNDNDGWTYPSLTKYTELVSSGQRARFSVSLATITVSATSASGSIVTAGSTATGSIDFIIARDAPAGSVSTSVTLGEGTSTPPPPPPGLTTLFQPVHTTAGGSTSDDFVEWTGLYPLILPGGSINTVWSALVNGTVPGGIGPTVLGTFPAVSTWGGPCKVINETYGDMYTVGYDRLFWEGRMRLERVPTATQYFAYITTTANESYSTGGVHADIIGVGVTGTGLVTARRYYPTPTVHTSTFVISPGTWYSWSIGYDRLGGAYRVLINGSPVIEVTGLDLSAAPKAGRVSLVSSGASYIAYPSSVWFDGLRAYVP